MTESQQLALRKKNLFHHYKLLISITGLLALAYLSTCVLLFLRQRYIIFRPNPKILTLPSSPDFRLPYQDVLISTATQGENLHGWWVSAPLPQEKFLKIPNEPVQVLSSPKVVLYFCGAAGNKSYYNHVARLHGLRQLGFSVLVIDYRGFGRTQGSFPSESQIYQDSQVAWNYLVKEKHIPPNNIVIYGESLGGAVALDLAVQHPEVRGLIMQSSFTSMVETIKHRDGFWLFPVDLLLTQRFDSLSKIRFLRVPVLFIHGTADTVVPSYMSQELYNAASQPKQILLIPGGGHFQIYQPGSNSYLRAIAKFIKKVELQ
ncbi:alpha/beta hydrolase [Scytonema sp. NUACC26]|uniref:alpha/beta hydrolase n=1 Tax=Scytonema sp. NUACC26 TaxID=3140176 RepID=UPI0034DCB678